MNLEQIHVFDPVHVKSHNVVTILYLTRPRKTSLIELHVSTETQLQYRYMHGQFGRK